MRGKVILIGLMTPDEAQYWVKMPIPEIFKNKVKAMECHRISMNVEFTGCNIGVK